MFITEKRIREIEQLIPEHKEALLAYDADMFGRGVITQVVFRVRIYGGCWGFVTKRVLIIYKYRKFKKNHEEGS